MARKTKPKGGQIRVPAQAEAIYGAIPSPLRAGRIGGGRKLVKYREAALAAELVGEVEKTGTDVKTLCGQYGLKREELGRLTGFSLRALAEWSAGKLPSQPAQRRLHEVRRLLDALDDIVLTEAISPWLHERNPAFDDLTPLQVIEFGEIDRLWGMIYDMKAGSVS